MVDMPNGIICPSCGKAKRPSLGMCRECWSQIPKELRDTAYRTGQKQRRRTPKETTRHDGTTGGKFVSRPS